MPTNGVSTPQLQLSTPATALALLQRGSTLPAVRPRPLLPERTAKRPLCSPTAEHPPSLPTGPVSGLDVSPSLLDLDDLDDLLPDPGFDLDGTDPLADLLPWPLEMPGLLPPMHHSPLLLAKAQVSCAAVPQHIYMTSSART